MKPKKLLNLNFMLLFQGQFISQVGSAAYGVGVLFWLKHETNSATLLGALSMTAMLPTILLGPFGGTIVDHYSRKIIIVLGDVVNGCIVLSIACVMLYYQDSSRLVIILLFISALTSGIIGAFFRPAISASIPDLVPTEKILTANGLIQSSMQLSVVAGQLIGSVLFRVLGAPMLLLINGITYIISAFSEIFITIPQRKIHKGNGWKEMITIFKTDTIHGIRFVQNTLGLKELFLILAAGNFFLTPLGVLLPFFVEDTLRVTTDWFGILLTGQGVGMVLGGFLPSVLKIPTTHKGMIVIFVVVFEGVIVSILGYSGNVVNALILMTLFGICMGTANVLLISALQLRVPSEMRGRVFGLLGTIAGGLMPIATVLAGIVADLTDKNIPIIYMGCGLIFIPINLILIFKNEFHQFMAGENEMDEVAFDSK